MKFYDVMTGQVFLYKGALFVVTPYNWELTTYPTVCIASRNPYYSVGNEFYFNENAEIKLISSQVLKTDFIPKDVDYEME